MNHTTANMVAYLDEEIARTKNLLNSAGYSNDTAINYIVRQYRKALKDYRKLIADDKLDGVHTYS